MSLIINMLKDLEKRKDNREPLPPVMTSQQHFSTVKEYPFFKIGIAAAGIVLSLIIIANFFMHKRYPHVMLALPAEQIQQKNPEPAATPSQNELAATTINAVSFETKNNDTEITFILNHTTLYRIVSNKNHELTLYLDNAVMRSDLPNLADAEVGIQNITATTTGNLLKFSIQLKDNAILKSINMSKEGDNPALVMTIGYYHTAPVEVMTSNSHIKSPAMETIITDKYQNAVKLAETGNRKDAIVTLTKLLEYYPDYNDVRVSLAAIYLEAGNPVKARQIIDDGLMNTPDYLPLIELKARLLTSEGKIKEALMVLQSEQPLISEAPQYHAIIAALYNRENNYQLAAEIYRKLVQINPHEGSWWFGLGVSLDKLGSNQDALYAYTKAATEGRLNMQAMAFLQTRLQTLRELSNVKK